MSRPVRSVLLAVAALGVLAAAFLYWAALARVDLFGSNTREARAAGEVMLSRERPVMVVEFAASLEARQTSGLIVLLRQIRPDRPEELDALASIRREVWRDDEWVPLADSPPAVEREGLNEFRFRWVLQLSEGVTAATIPVEVAFEPAWEGGGDAPPPDDEDADRVSVSIVDIYPAPSNER